MVAGRNSLTFSIVRGVERGGDFERIRVSSVKAELYKSNGNTEAEKTKNRTTTVNRDLKLLRSRFELLDSGKSSAEVAQPLLGLPLDYPGL
jgi:hypothetical protein